MTTKYIKRNKKELKKITKVKIENTKRFKTKLLVKNENIKPLLQNNSKSELLVLNATVSNMPLKPQPLNIELELRKR